MATFAGTSTGSTPGVSSTTGGVTTANAIHGSSTSVFAAIWGDTTAESSAGIVGTTSATTGYGVYGASASGDYGVFGSAPEGAGVHGSGQTAVEGITDIDGGWGVFARTDNNNSTGVLSLCYGYASYAGYFGGDVDIQGNLSKTGGSFLIDHPLDPANRYLEHSFVESPERKNVHDGTGVADASGNVVVSMPAYVEIANANFRYQLTALNAPAPGLFIKQELSGGSFVIGGAAPGQKVCWQLTGTRKDAWAATHPLVVERDKPDDEKGLYRHPEVHGEPADKGIAYQKVIKRRRPSQQPPALGGG